MFCVCPPYPTVVFVLDGARARLPRGAQRGLQTSDILQQRDAGQNQCPLRSTALGKCCIIRWAFLLHSELSPVPVVDKLAEALMPVLVAALTSLPSALQDSFVIYIQSFFYYFKLLKEKKNLPPAKLIFIFMTEIKCGKPTHTSYPRKCMITAFPPQDDI